MSLPVSSRHWSAAPRERRGSKARGHHSLQQELAPEDRKLLIEMKEAYHLRKKAERTDKSKSKRKGSEGGAEGAKKAKKDGDKGDAVKEEPKDEVSVPRAERLAPSRQGRQAGRCFAPLAVNPVLQETV